jgi:thioredoxin-related protein
MKKVLLFFSLFLFSIAVFATNSTIDFRSIDYDDLFETAKKERKPVFLYFHFTGCGACVKMEKTAFKDQKVIDYFNENFVSFEINTTEKVGAEINKNYNVRSHPEFLFLDPNEKKLHRLVGVFSSEDFLQHAQNVINSGKTLSLYKELYKEKKEDKEFVLDYVHLLRDATELDSMMIHEYLNLLSSEEWKEEKNVRFIYEFSQHRGKTIMSFESPYFDFMNQNKALFAKYFDANQVDVRLLLAINDAVFHAVDNGDKKSFNKAIEFLRPYDTGEHFYFKEMDGRATSMLIGGHRVLFTQEAFHAKNGPVEKHKEVLKEYISKIWDNPDQLNDFAWGVYLNPNEIAPYKLKEAIKCSERSIALSEQYAFVDTYASLLYKAGDKENALTQASKAIALAKENKEDFTETQKLIEKIKAED